MDRLDWVRILPPWLFPLAATAVGLILGSFANVCIHRLPRGLSVVWARSECPRCGARVRAWDNLPLVSWLILAGRCRDCRAPISWRYPLVEGMAGLLSLALAWRFGPHTGGLVMGLFALALLILFFTDLETMLLPDWITLGGVAVGLGLAPWNPLLPERVGALPAMGLALAGAAGGAGLILAVMVAWRVWSRWRFPQDISEELRTGMGQGDLKMLAFIGAFVGLRQVFFVTFAAALMGSLFGLAMMMRRRAHRHTLLPFGTFLALAGIGSIFYGRRIVDLYLSLLAWP